MDTTIGVGLQEWQVCCDALVSGSLLLSVRKGGIHERQGGLFRPEYDTFALMPTWLHQDARRIRTGAVTAPPTPGVIPVAAWAHVAQVWKVTDLDRVLGLGSDLIWTEAELRTRFAYRDQPWLYVLALRVYTFAAPIALADDPSYAGCRSWIPLRDSLSTGGSRPVVNDAAFTGRLAALMTQLQAS